MATRKTGNTNNTKKIIKNNKIKNTSNIITFKEISEYFNKKEHFSERDIKLLNKFNQWIEYNDKLARDGSLSGVDSLQNLDDNDF